MYKKNLILLLLFITVYQVQSQKINKFRFVFMTDIHVEYGNNASKGFSKAIKEAEKLKPDFIITGGDLIMDALQQRYTLVDSLYNLYNTLIKTTKIPFYNCMGNHEIWAWGLKTDTLLSDYGKKFYEKRISPSYYSKNIKGWHFIFLSSIQRDYNGIYYGGIDIEQVEWLKKDLLSIDKKMPVAIITHIPFITLLSQYYNGSTSANGKGDVITNSKEVLALFKSYNLKLILQGHLHYYEKLEIEGLTLFTGGAVCGSWWKGPYSKTEEGFVVVDVNGDNFKANYFDFKWDVKK